MAAGLAYKEAGNAAFKAGETARALGQYARVQGCVGGLEAPAALTGVPAIGMLAAGLRDRPPPPSGAQLAALHALLDSVSLNSAACYARPGPTQNWQRVYECADRVLARDPRSAKALFRRGQALLQYGETDRAIEDLSGAHSLLPADGAIGALLAQARRAVADKNAQDERRMRAQFANMFK